MNKLKKINKFLKKLIYIALFFLLLGLSYAFFTANITGSESSTTISASGGTMDVTFNGGSSINMSKMYPRPEAWGTKTFTVTGNNTTLLTMNYYLNLVMKVNTFSYGSLKYTLTSTNTGGNGQVVPSITTMQEVGSGPKTIVLGAGNFAGPTSGNKVHTYNLKIYFPETGEDQGYDSGKVINAYVTVEEGLGATNEYLADALIDNYGGSTDIEIAPSGTFDSINGSTDNLMYKMEDDYGMSYYYRGAKNYVNNNLIFAEHQWKIVRINGDGSVRLIYNGTCPNDTCTINSTGESTQIGTSAFNTNYNDNKYVGYMYGGAAGEASTSRMQATTNETSSTIKTAIDTWYLNNIYNTEYEDYISDTLFCNDRQLQSEVGGAATGTGFGTSETYYAAYYRLYTKKIPNIKCGLKNDRFTVSDTVKGNGALTYPIGLLTPDETAIAGLKFGTSNYTNYLYTNQYWWTLGPSAWGGGGAHALVVSSSGNLDGGYVFSGSGARGVLNLKSNTKVVGTGSASNPYLVQNETSLGNKILAQYGGKENIIEAPIGTFANINGSTDNLMYKMEDDYGISYYYRGAKDHVNNNIIFAEHQWKIVRINGDGSIRIIYNGTCPNNSCTINTTGTSTQIGTSAFNTNYNDNKYVGYMYGGTAGTASTSRVQATTNETNSTIKAYLDNWYSTNISGTAYEDYISDTLFCNDRQLQSEIGGAATGTGYGSSATNYAAYYRLYTNKLPDLQCGLQNDRFTVLDITKGNGALTYPIGLLSADEASIAGLVYVTANSTNYLYTNQSWWLISPYDFYSGYAIEFYVYSDGGLSNNSVNISRGGRPVLNLKPNISYSGTGTTTDPYVVEI